jgi:hypothetical protein
MFPNASYYGLFELDYRQSSHDETSGIPGKPRTVDQFTQTSRSSSYLENTAEPRHLNQAV